ncbi:bifunctional diaminohydroxyphosphoribosylaminopyrimidine deaminase/5-amino-6-(5-phosphoribosylamino)uracil reductase RibD [Sphingomonas sp. BGYR3]|uniref:bifunctional diaminohydroxyphosphoribosylaminopyrimidine deaminase/5-amino-6-(5-phosphoribosylamino)uracil reductase RibD n=1 Tax=Sphingomonas sp. BGYR3 TaxID=2975483 RepID=UPI0021A33EBC|nr:bifunctional diaminohydroxyphosphoribosylaminopyrimidine deaminase/5-amino-6-(5-phosphoribosylamino)uracil reductase RibD [Sphingomonas sp. BGYR3]MDG5488698.1 bifunctional diaminohydroxyphosphoribosylaminopyrimidine deaminase/5-amino-6-(5-phosphoribosylamino)uracil reductase RibD [Sphingomonas sp. BGYR3]
MAAAIALAERTRGLSDPNPNVGCIVLAPDGRVVGRGWTQPGGRPHAEAMALAQAGDAARGGTLYTTLEPCCHLSPRGPACADLILAAGIARVVAAMGDPDPRVSGGGHARLRDAGIALDIGTGAVAAAQTMAGFLTRQVLGRPLVTLKLALSLDGAAAMADGSSRWITGPQARAHTHLERARHGAILVGRGTWLADRPALDVRLPGLHDRSPARYVLTGAALEGVETLASPGAIAGLPVNHLLVEGGMQTAATFLSADLVDRLLLYRAPILIGGGRTLPDLGLGDLSAAHGRWHLLEQRMLGSDTMQLYQRAR